MKETALALWKARDWRSCLNVLSARSMKFMALGQIWRPNISVLWVPTADLALTRVRARVLGGGHDVPEAVVRRRFGRSIRNFLLHYRLLGDSWMLFDNSGAVPAVIAFENHGSLRIINQGAYDTLNARYGKP
jgi:predicted ABC-type ATPase